MPQEVATLGGGCFWCTEAIFKDLKGIERVESGYSGGTVANPNYEEVCTGRTGHAETIQITFDSEVVSYKDILRIFFTVHDPTTPNRQGSDVGTQYRSAIFFHNNEQMAAANEVIKEVAAAKIWDGPIITQIVPFTVFYKAEEYHQDYFKNNPGQSYCRVIIAPKVRKFREHYKEKLRTVA